MPLVSTVLIIGAGDLGERFTAGLAAAGAVRRLVLVSRTGAAEAAAMLASAHNVVVEVVACDASRPGDVAGLLTRIAPNLVVQSAAGRGPWALAGRDDAAARAGAEPLRWSVPSPGGLPGGYPVRIDGGAVSLDLPAGLSRDEAIAFNERMAHADGVARIDEDGTVHFTAACRDAVAALDPGLADPLPLGDLAARAARLDAALA